MSRILTLVSDSDVPVANKRFLHSSLSALSQTPTLPKKIHTRVGPCLLLLDAVPDGPFVLVETEEFRRMEQSQSELEKRSSEMVRHEKELETRINDLQHELEEEKKTGNTEDKKQIELKEARKEKVKTERENIQLIRIVEELKEEKKKAEREKFAAGIRQALAKEQIGQAEVEKAKLADEVKRTREDLGNARRVNEKIEREKRELIEKIARMRRLIRTEWKGTESLLTLDRTAHALSPTTLPQLNKISVGSTDFRTAFTFPIDEGEWELIIRPIETVIGFLEHPLPEKATQHSCGSWGGGIGGHFFLWTGGMWQGGTFKPAGTNKKCQSNGQIIAIRVNMTMREARLVVDEKEQPGIFTNIPSPICLGITTGFVGDKRSVEVLWLKKLRD
ncbi:hypothetical protein BLNAU_14531 [Blattamonas nauphoetae]|uniref:Uncharacterized protein n=1 Tax=Blattamonas nauphoetae TaxID=2049346 RepID=A0ABQ9XGR4_9EUKA|nr:hypothetical protein BLNAU_14531 [Blattamonas nauphoetae]